MMSDLRKCNSCSFLKKVKETIFSNNMFQYGDRVLVAVSGGADSMALLYSLFFLSNEIGLNLGVAHLNHNLRDFASREDSVFVKSVAEKLGLPFYCVSADILRVKRGLKLSIEESARRVRYAFFRKIMITKSFSKVALGHHMDDNAELILMFICRGSGLKGISGIPFIRNGCFVRPLIQFHKTKILEFLKKKKIKHREDDSNNDLRFMRNKIRHKLVPFLIKSYNPRIVENLNRMALLVGEEDEYMNQVVDIEYKKALVSFDDDMILFSTRELNNKHLAIRRRILRKALELIQGSLKRISFVHIESIIKLLKDTSGVKYLDLPNLVQVVRTYDMLEFRIGENNKVDISYDFRKTLSGFDKVERFKIPVTLQNDKFRFNFSVVESFDLSTWRKIDNKTALLDLKFLQFPLSIRYVEEQDRMRPLGLFGSQKIRKYFSNKKVPLTKRLNSLVVVDSEGSIIWLVSHTICDFAKVTRSTQRIFKVEFCLKNNGD